jgi:hypothetical protein
MNTTSNIPPITAKVRLEYLYGNKRHHGEAEDCIIHAVTTLEGRTPLFSILLPNGAFYTRLPITAFFQPDYERKEVKDVTLKDISYWDSFAYHHQVISFTLLGTSKCKFINRKKNFVNCNYLFTIDYCSPDQNMVDTTFSEISKEHKFHHVLEIDDTNDWRGNFALMPNNKILFHLPNYTVKNEIPDYELNMEYQSVECDFWQTEDSDKQFYNIEENNEEDE